MGRKWMWFTLVVALLLSISLEAATADGNGSVSGNGGNGGGGKGNGADNSNKGEENNGNHNGNGKGNEGDNGNGKGNGDDNSNKGGNEKGNQGGNGGNQSPPSTPYYPPPSQTPAYYPPPSPTPPSSTPPSSTPPSNPPPIIPSPSPRDDTINYYLVSPVERTGQEQAYCAAQNRCFHRNLTCPPECPHRKPVNNKLKGCFIDCSSVCEATCRWRMPNCDDYGALCYDPRFVGGDGNVFYFHGSKGSDFAIVSDDKLQINAHFIGIRPVGRTRDFTWVQALSIMFDSHTLVLAAKRVSKWDDKVESLIVKWDGEMINIPTDGEAEWRIKTEENRVVIVERTDDLNTVRATVSGLAQVDTRVVPIGEQENKVHHYQIPSDDVFAHLETQFKFFKLSSSVEGVLGRTYQPGFQSPVKMGVVMPMMGGEEKYQTPSVNSPLCKACKFQRPSSSSSIAMVTTAAM